MAITNEEIKFCPIPFKGITIMHGGNRTYSCCWIEKSIGSILDVGDMNELCNTSLAIKIRKSIIEGNFKYCNSNYCPYLINNSLPKLNDCLKEEYWCNVIQANGTIENSKVWCAFDPRCNLKCISCRREYLKISNELQSRIISTLTVLSDNLNKISGIGFSGSGEPFYSPDILNFISEFDSNKYPNIDMYIISNGQLLNKTRWGRLYKRNKSIKGIQISIDAATEKTYNRIRKGGNYNILKKNLSYISFLRKNNIIKEFIIAFVVNRYNLSELNKFAKYGIELGCDQVNFTKIDDWGVYKEHDFNKISLNKLQTKERIILEKQINNVVMKDHRIFLGNMENYIKNRVLRDTMFI